MDEELDLETIERMLAEPQPTGTRTPRTRKKDEDTRTVQSWFRLLHVSGSCEVPNHDEDERPRNKGMTVVINDIHVCRVCFLGLKDIHG